MSQLPVEGYRKLCSNARARDVWTPHRINQIQTLRRKIMQLSMTKLILMAVIITFTAALGAPIWAQKEKPLTKSQAMALLTSAEKPEDHERLAEYFNIKAAKLE